MKNKMTSEKWKYTNLINLALDVGCTEIEIVKNFEGDAETKEMFKALVKLLIDKRKI